MLCAHARTCVWRVCTYTCARVCVGGYLCVRCTDDTDFAIVLDPESVPSRSFDAVRWPITSVAWLYPTLKKAVRSIESIARYHGALTISVLALLRKNKSLAIVNATLRCPTHMTNVHNFDAFLVQRQQELAR